MLGHGGSGPHHQAAAAADSADAGEDQRTSFFNKSVRWNFGVRSKSLNPKLTKAGKGLSEIRDKK